MKKLLIAFIALFSFHSLSFAAAENSVPAVQGYDVVSYFTAKRPARGSGHFTAEHNGATYLFANADNLKLFNADPAKYAPAYNGYCAFGVSVGKKFIADPEVWRIENGRLFLNLDANIQKDWLKDIPGRVKSADAKWKDIEHKAPSAL